MTVHDDIFVLVMSGTKSLIAPNRPYQVGQQQGVMIARGTQWDVVNDPHGMPRYEALVLSFSDAMIRDLNSLEQLPRLISVQGAEIIAVDEELQEALKRTCIPHRARPMTQHLLYHRAMEVLLLLATKGYRFKPAETITWAERVRRLIAQRPHIEWSVASLAEAFHMSESTLRRRCEEEQWTVAKLVKEVRLETALALLQTTGQSIGEIAQYCGWASHSRFSASFQHRWGVAPSAVRGRLKENAQSLTEIG